MASWWCIVKFLHIFLLKSGSSNKFLCRKRIRINNYVSWLHWQSCKLRRKWKSRFGRLAKFQLGMQYCQYTWDLYKHSLYARLDWLYFGQKSMKVMNENTKTVTYNFPLSFIVTDCMKKILVVETVHVRRLFTSSKEGSRMEHLLSSSMIWNLLT